LRKRRHDGYEQFAFAVEGVDTFFLEIALDAVCKQSSKVHTFSPANAHFFSASFLAGNGLVVS
jgi:hypothetical protein